MKQRKDLRTMKKELLNIVKLESIRKRYIRSCKEVKNLTKMERIYLREELLLSIYDIEDRQRWVESIKNFFSNALTEIFAVTALYNKGINGTDTIKLIWMILIIESVIQILSYSINWQYKNRKKAHKYIIDLIEYYLK